MNGVRLSSRLTPRAKRQRAGCSATGACGSGCTASRPGTSPLARRSPRSSPTPRPAHVTPGVMRPAWRDTFCNASPAPSTMGSACRRGGCGAPSGRLAVEAMLRTFAGCEHTPHDRALSLDAVVPVVLERVALVTEANPSAAWESGVLAHYRLQRDRESSRCCLSHRHFSVFLPVELRARHERTRRPFQWGRQWGHPRESTWR